MRFNKYGAKKTEVDGQIFDSKLEANFYQNYLSLLAKAEGWTIDRQVRYTCAVNGIHICDYIADFVTIDKEGIKTIWECKGMWIGDAKMKLRLVQALYGFDIMVVKSLKDIEKLKGYRKR